LRDWGGAVRCSQSEQLVKDASRTLPRCPCRFGCLVLVPCSTPLGTRRRCRPCLCDAQRKEFIYLVASKGCSTNRGRNVARRPLSQLTCETSLQLRELNVSIMLSDYSSQDDESMAYVPGIELLFGQSIHSGALRNHITPNVENSFRCRSTRATRSNIVDYSLGN
jgi:hypothetical protein